MLEQYSSDIAESKIDFYTFSNIASIMDTEQIITQVTSSSTEQQTIEEILTKNGIPKQDITDLRKIIQKVIKIIKKPEARTSFLRSYFRIYEKGILKDGRSGSIVIELTKRCNLNCKHCYSKMPGTRESIDDETLHSIIKMAREKFKHIFLTGGEPTLDPRVLTVPIEYPDILFFVFTNGSQMTDEYAEKMSKVSNLVPILSIDGSTAELNDALRGARSYDTTMKAIDALNSANVQWGFISVVNNKNADDVLSPEFARFMHEKGAFVVRYLEFLPIGKNALKDFILSGENYYKMEKMRKDVEANEGLYIQETLQDKCTGLPFFDVEGNIKNCPFFHYSKHNAKEGNIYDNILDSQKDWLSAKFEGECPLYSDPKRFKDHLTAHGWKHTYPYEEEYLNNSDIYKHISNNYKRYLELRNTEGL